ncbi:MAG TPA: thioesterase family protein [Acidimicrobiia bacterium]|nr:thioesterase family protein [Acidimicrobiia bacterium]
MGDLAADTAVTGGDGRYTCALSRDWEIWGPNGGYMAAIALRAAGEHSRFERPASIVGHFLGVAEFDTVDIEVTILRAAKRAESARVSIKQHGQPMFDAMVWSVGDVEGFEHDFTEMPRVPDPDELPTNAERMAKKGEPEFTPYVFWKNFEQKIPDDKWIDDWESRPPRAAEYSQWYRYVPVDSFADPWVDACRLLILVDTLGWPAAGQPYPQGKYMAPSIDLLCAFHRDASHSPWLYAQALAPSASAGIIGCESRVWTREGALAAVGMSQLLCRPAPWAQ